MSAQHEYFSPHPAADFHDAVAEGGYQIKGHPSHRFGEPVIYGSAAVEVDAA